MCEKSEFEGEKKKKKKKKKKTKRGSQGFVSGCLMLICDRSKQKYEIPSLCDGMDKDGALSKGGACDVTFSGVASGKRWGSAFGLFELFVTSSR